MELSEVTGEAAAAARLRLVLDEKLGRETPELIRRIARLEPAGQAEETPDRVTIVVDLGEFAESAQVALKRFVEQGLAAWLLRIGLDTVQALNETVGPGAGDTALREVGRLLLAECGPADLLARLGADEFVALVARSPQERDGGVAVAERMRRAVAQHDWAKLLGADQPVRISVGVAAAPAHEPIATAVRRADRTMALARKQGGDRVAAEPQRGTGAGQQYPGWSIGTSRKRGPFG